MFFDALRLEVLYEKEEGDDSLWICEKLNVCVKVHCG